MVIDVRKALADATRQGRRSVPAIPQERMEAWRATRLNERLIRQSRAEDEAYRDLLRRYAAERARPAVRTLGTPTWTGEQAGGPPRATSPAAPSSGQRPDIIYRGKEITAETLEPLAMRDLGNVVFEDCTFRCNLDLSRVHCRFLSLEGSRIRTVFAPDIRVDGSVVFKDVQPESDTDPARLLFRGARIDGSVKLVGAKLRGDTSNGSFPYALDLAETTIGMAVSTIDHKDDDVAEQRGYTASFDGGITFNRATIEKTVWLRGIKVKQGEDSVGLNFEGARVMGDLILDGAEPYRQPKLGWSSFDPLFNFRAAYFGRQVLIDYAFTSEGVPDFSDYGAFLMFGDSMSVQGDLWISVEGGTVAGFRPILSFRDLRVGASARIYCERVRRLDLENAVIETNLILGKNQGNREKDGLTVSRRRFEFRDKNGAFEASDHDAGSIDLLNARIGGRLTTDRIRLFDDCTDLHAFGPVEETVTPLTCYPGWTLHDVVMRRGNVPKGPRIAFSFLKKGGQVRVLTGESGVFHTLNDEGALDLSTPEKAFEYLRIFCHFLYGGARWSSWSTFRLRLSDDPSDADGFRKLFRRIPDHERSADLQCKDAIPDGFPNGFEPWKDPACHRFRLQKREKGYRAQTVVVYQGIYFLAIFDIRPDGSVEMLDDQPLSLDGENPIIQPLATPITYEGFRILAPYEFPFTSELTREKKEVTPFCAGIVKRWRKKSYEQLIGEENVVRVRRNPFRIDLRNADVAILDDNDGKAWWIGFRDTNIAACKVRIALENLTYEAIFDDLRPAEDPGPRDPEYDPEENRLDDFAKATGASETDSPAPKEVRALRSAPSGRDYVKTKAYDRVKWINRQLVDPNDGAEVHSYENYCAQPFRQLISVLDRSGESEIARRVSIEWIKTKHKVAEASAPNRLVGLFRMLGNRILRHCFEYGHGWRRALGGMLILILIGMLGAGRLERTGFLVADERGQPANGSSASCQGVADFFVYSADVFIPVVSFEQRHRCRIRAVSGMDKARYEQPAAGPIEWISRRGRDPRSYEVLRGLYILLGWSWTALTGLTITGILRRAGMRE